MFEAREFSSRQSKPQGVSIALQNRLKTFNARTQCLMEEMHAHKGAPPMLGFGVWTINWGYTSSRFLFCDLDRIPQGCILNSPIMSAAWTFTTEINPGEQEFWFHHNQNSIYLQTSIWANGMATLVSLNPLAWYYGDWVLMSIDQLCTFNHSQQVGH